MLVIELTFPAGRYHATPWGRHVNEGEAEWPPSPYRLVRALFDAWKRKRPDWEPARVKPVLAALASCPPHILLPAAAVSHTRSYLNTNSGTPEGKTLVFDAFVALPPRAAVLMGWPGVDLNPRVQADLDDLLASLNYLGRSESWVSARLLPGVDGARWNCRTAGDGAGAGDRVTVACAAPNTGDADWLDALAYSTADLLREKRSEPPAMQYVEYLRPADCFSGRIAPRAIHGEEPLHGVIYALESKVRPQVTCALEIAERVRIKLMGIHKALAGGPEHVSPSFSGKDAEGKPLSGHRHMFVLPFDEDRDGRLDHLLVICSKPFDHLEQLALDRLESLWQPGGKPDIRCVPVRWDSSDRLTTAARRVASFTPFVPTRHHRRGRGVWIDWIEREVALECARHGMPEPLRVHLLDRCMLQGGRSYRWIEFRRNRKGDDRGEAYGFEIEFAEPVPAPFALGYGCHFGLGQFWPV